MRWHIFIIVAFAVVLGKLLFSPVLEIEGISPDLVIILVAHISLSTPKQEALIACWCLGLLQDVASAEAFGVFTLFYLLGVGLLLWITKSIETGHPVFPILFTFFLTLLCQLLHASILMKEEAMEFVVNSILCALYTTLIAPWFILLLHKLPLIKHAKDHQTAN